MLLNIFVRNVSFCQKESVNVYQNFKQIFSLITLIQGIHPKEIVGHVCKDFHTRMFIVVLLVTGKTEHCFHIYRLQKYYICVTLCPGISGKAHSG